LRICAVLATNRFSPRENRRSRQLALTSVISGDFWLARRGGRGG